jgi:hypothetical protein
MVPTFTALTASMDADNQTSYTTAAITPTANRVLVAFVGNSLAASPATPTLSGGGVSTWTQVATVVSIGGDYRLTSFRALTGASPTSAAVTIDCGGATQNNCAWSIVEVADSVLTGTNGADAVAQSKTSAPASTGTTATVTFDGAYGHADNKSLAGFIVGAGRTLTAGTNFTLLSQVVMSSPSGTVGVIYGRDSDLVSDISWTSGTQRAGMALEIVGGSAAAPPSVTALPQLNTRGFNRWMS